MVPANAFLVAVLLGLLLGTGSRAKCLAATKDAPKGFRWFRWFTAPAIIAMMAACIFAAALNTLTDAWISPLRRAVVMQRAKHPDLTESQKNEMLRAALPAALQAARWTPLNSGHAATIGQAYLYLSGGRKSPELKLAYRWFAHSLRVCPVDRSIRKTVEEIADVLLESPDLQTAHRIGHTAGWSRFSIQVVQVPMSARLQSKLLTTSQGRVH